MTPDAAKHALFSSLIQAGSVLNMKVIWAGAARSASDVDGDFRRRLHGLYGEPLSHWLLLVLFHLAFILSLECCARACGAVPTFFCLDRPMSLPTLPLSFSSASFTALKSDRAECLVDYEGIALSEAFKARF